MDSSDQKGEGKKKVNEIQTFPVPFALGEKKENITITTNTPSKPSKEQIINQAIQFHLKGNIPEATKYYQYCINQGFENHIVLSNYGAILQGLGKLEEAEKWFRKASEIKPDFADAHLNLGSIFKELKNFQDFSLGYGHFSTIHVGHIRYLKKAKRLSKKLVIALKGDFENKEEKSRYQFNQEERAEALSLLDIADAIILLKNDELLEVIKNSSP